MSIINEISSIEQKLQQIRDEANKEILAMQSEYSKKKEQIQVAFDEELLNQQKKLEAEMLDRIKEYKKTLHDSDLTMKDKLEQQFLKKKEDIIKIICAFFWEG